MTAFVLLSLALGALAAALLTRHAWWPGAGPDRQVRALAQQRKQLADLRASGVLNETQFAEAQRALESKLLDSLAPTTGTAVRVVKMPPRMALSLAVFMLIVALGGYRVVGSPDHLALAPGATSAETAHAATPQQVEAMVERLAERLKARPDDAEGWVMLARSYVVLGRHAQAVDAFKQATRLHPEDASLLADMADALAMSNDRQLRGEPMQLIEQALRIDPGNVKALSLAGTAAFDNKDYASAVRYWERAIKTEPPDSAFVQQVKAGISEARQLAGMPAAAPEAAPAPAAVNVAQSAGTAAPAASIGPAQVSGTVTLAQPLLARVSPDDTVFVFARAAQGPRMPLAILRKQVKDLPLKFTLDDTMAMSPQATLSSTDRVVVGARVSRSGNAMPQPGDLQGITQPVAVGTGGLRVEIDQEVGK